MAGTLFASSCHFVDPFTTKWLIFCYGLALFGFVSYINYFHSTDRPFNYFFCPIWVIILLALVEAVYGIFVLWVSGASYAIGTFDNTAGFAACLCVAFPFCIYEIKTNKGWLYYFAIALTVIVAIAVLLSGSRAGVISLLFVLVATLWKRIHLSTWVKWTLLQMLLLICIIILYYIKKDSADGRLLIWLCSLKMIIDRPLLGWGIGGFEAHYMDYQAAYFRQHPDSSFVLLADNVQYPFNEYLNIGITFGWIGLLLALFLGYYLIRQLNQQSSLEKESGLLCWLTIVVFSFFSYPLMYPFVWLMLLYSTYLILRENTKWKILRFVRYRIRAYMCLCLSICIGYYAYQRTLAELVWKKAVDTAVWGKNEEAMEIYKRIYPRLKTDRYFLYNYAAELYNSGRYDTSLVIALECRMRWADYDLEMLLGELYEQVGEVRKAESSYLKASCMCPNRFLPLYRLVKLCVKSGNDSEALLIANKILEKPIKIPSHTIDVIRKEMKEYVEKEM